MGQQRSRGQGKATSWPYISNRRAAGQNRDWGRAGRKRSCFGSIQQGQEVSSESVSQQAGRR